MKITGKEWYFSKTIWIAVLQGLVGVIVAAMAVNPELKLGGAFAMLKSVLDIIVRFQTSEEIR